MKALYLNFGFAAFIWMLWLLFGGSTALTAVVENWEITLTMTLGSFIAGFTSEGGGAVAFPVFTKLLEIAPSEARIFSLAIQSIGMTAASLTILVLRVKVEKRAILWCSLGGILGITLSTLFLLPYISPPLVKVIFTVMVTLLGIALLVMNLGNINYRNTTIPEKSVLENPVLFTIGIFGGVMSGLVGSGIDIITFIFLVLYFRICEKVATPTSVLLMTVNTIVGFTLHLFVLQDFTSQIMSYWFAAIPVVVVGAPFGAYMCTRVSGKLISWILIGLIAVEFLTTAWLVPMSEEVLAFGFVTLFIGSILYFIMGKYSAYAKTSNGE